MYSKNIRSTIDIIYNLKTNIYDFGKECRNAVTHTLLLSRTLLILINVYTQ